MNSPLPNRRKLNVTSVMYTIQSKSKKYPNALEVDINENQAELCKSWWLSNSCINISSASNALIVVKPKIDAFKWENTGLLAKK